ncbi:type II toxin-antitoxin system PemK/MazF family toxin [Aerosakkonema funiforme]|uniref:mRNA interferase n=1 Tax=Aerosakkonema funiforme FACHB-1375 TaxID=2949571 RepID=A0A926VLY9_9CYAN|nr:type II toxin-antitoxin system PemK/MazF family toxin [Aerosakkonema funiforme]MBD2186118.1 type II toxin-antitoxin system PemK/MazF family toxin [Aerosakkonema funiforme FACHB-1375]
MRGDLYLADLNPSRGSEQAGIRPVIIVQRDILERFTTTIVVVPLTTNLRRARIPGTIVIPAGEGGLTEESVALCYQIVVIDKQRLIQKLGTISANYLLRLKEALEYTLQIDDYDDENSEPAN